MKLKLIGGILLVTGTTIGGGMLALPIISAESGFFWSALLLVLCWLVMMLSALLLLEVNLWMPHNTNIISMAKSTLGPLGALVAWLAYMVLLYSLLSAYIASGTDIVHNALQLLHITLPVWLCTCFFVLILGLVVYKGIQSVDYVNRGLMSAKLFAYVLLIAIALPSVHVSHLTYRHPALLSSSVMVMIASYGFASIVPSLRAYFKGDIVQLRKVILIGSAIPLVCYIIWNLVILGVLPRDGENGLLPMLHSASSTSDLVNALMHTLHNPRITNLAHLFVAICVLTSFLAVSLGLTDFLADGIGVEKKGKGAFIVYMLAFLPPLFIVLFYPGLFIKGLNYAGICCVILLVLLPALMAWRGRYKLKIAKGYELSGGKMLPVALGIAAILILGLGALQL